MLTTGFCCSIKVIEHMFWSNWGSDEDEDVFGESTIQEYRTVDRRMAYDSSLPCCIKISYALITELAPCSWCRNLWSMPTHLEKVVDSLISVLECFKGET